MIGFDVFDVAVFEVFKRFLTFTPFSVVFAGAWRWRRSASSVALAGIFLALSAAFAPVRAATAVHLIRDAEIESIIRSFATPLFKAADLNPKDVKIHLVQDKTLNAFVAGGQNIYINTGLIMKVENVDALMGVIAHETGHIEHGDLVRAKIAIKDAGTIRMIGTILGTVAAAALGRGDLGQAVVLGSASMGARSFFQYSRTQESAADEAAMRLMDANKRSSKGLENFLRTLEGEDLLSPRLQDPYVRTHPLSRQRIQALHKHNNVSPYADAPIPEKQHLAFARMVAKLYGYIEPLHKVLRRYPQTDQSFAARYARAIAYYRALDLKRALKLIDALIKQAPLDAYLQEMKGQMLFEHGRAREALVAYREAFRLAPHEPLLAMELARVEVELGAADDLRNAVTHYRLAIRRGEGSSFVWRQLGIAYGRLGNMGMSSLALAEAEGRMGNLGNAELQATHARDLLPKGSGGHLQALDILAAIKAARATRDQSE